MVEVKIHIEAEKEIIAASKYYESELKGLGEKFLDDLSHAIEQITSFPHAMASICRTIQTVSSKTFPL